MPVPRPTEKKKKNKFPRRVHRICPHTDSPGCEALISVDMRIASPPHKRSVYIIDIMCTHPYEYMYFCISTCTCCGKASGQSLSPPLSLWQWRRSSEAAQEAVFKVVQSALSDRSEFLFGGRRLARFCQHAHHCSLKAELIR